MYCGASRKNRSKTRQPRWCLTRPPAQKLTLIEKERVALLQQALQALPEAARSVLVLREYGGLSYQEIASVLDVPVGTVMSRLNYARNRLRELLKGNLVAIGERICMKRCVHC